MPVEEAAWPVVKNKIFEEATEIFLRLLRGEILSSSMIAARSLQRKDFRSDADWQRVIDAYGHDRRPRFRSRRAGSFRT